MACTIVRRFIALLALIILSDGSNAFARGGFWEEPTYPEAPLLGPEKAKGVVVYNHGTDTTESYHLPPASWVRLLQRDGWDVVSFKRKLAYDRVWEAEDALAEEVADLRLRGYQRIVLVGQSRGAWLSLVVAARSADVFAVVATAPGGYGDSTAGVSLSMGELSDRLQIVKGARVMIFLFEGDPREYRVLGGRGRIFDEALAKAGVPRLVVDRPPGFEGHTAAGSGRFARIYGECIRRFLNAAAVPRDFGCALDGGMAAGNDIPLPKDLAIPSSSDRFVGRWLSFYESGDARTLVVTSVDNGKAKGVFGWAPSPVADKPVKAGWEWVSCEIGGDALNCPRKEGTSVFRQTAADTLEYEWIPKDQGKHITAVYRRD